MYELLATDEGRARFWAESAIERDGVISFGFPNGMGTVAPVLEASPPTRYVLEYLGGPAVFDLMPDGEGGTDLLLEHRGIPEWEWVGTFAGWISVLLALKAAAQYGVDLRNHDPTRCWDQGYADN